MPLHPPGGHYRNLVVKLPELAVTDDLLEGLTFENCHIIGPAVIVGLGGEIRDCQFDGSLDAFLWPFEDDRDVVIGAIGLSDVGCTAAG